MGDQNKIEAVSEPPYWNAPSANFAEETSPVYALVGTVLDRTELPEDAPVQIQIAPGVMREYDAEFLPVFEFFRTPRLEDQVTEWLEWAGGDNAFLQALLDTRAIVRLNAHTAETSAKGLKGIRVVPQCTPVLDSDLGGNGLCEVTRGDKSSLLLSVELCEYMWGEWNKSDIPSFIKAMHTNRKYRTVKQLGTFLGMCQQLSDGVMRIWNGSKRPESDPLKSNS